MNYRHAFHAGNHADVLKHLVLARVLAHLGLKDKPFRALDAFAGLGFYDLDADEARRTGEWHEGWGRLAEPFPPLPDTPDNVDILHVTRTWVFVPGGTMRTE